MFTFCWENKFVTKQILSVKTGFEKLKKNGVNKIWLKKLFGGLDATNEFKLKQTMISLEQFLAHCPFVEQAIGSIG